MKKLLFIITAIVFTGMYSHADVEWLSDFTGACAIAKKKELPILANFTGSDWCPWCKRLDKEVFSTTDFKSWSSTNVVLFMVDFPRYKQLPETTSKQNKELLVKYGVRGFPTILLLDYEGRVIGQTGYKPGGALAYIEHLKELLATQKKTLTPSKP